MENDIAIITLNSDIHFSEEVGPTCLPFQHRYDSFAGNYVDLLGKYTFKIKRMLLQNYDLFRALINCFLLVRAIYTDNKLIINCFYFNVHGTGWGTTDFGGTKSNTLQKVTISVITNRDCRRTYQNLTYNHLCTYEEEKDACQVTLLVKIFHRTIIESRFRRIAVSLR